MALTEDIKDTDIIDIEMPLIKKKRFRINGDSSKILELNTSDFTILNRVVSTKKKLDSLAEDATSLSEKELKDNTLEGLEKLNEKLKRIDEKMRALIDELFNAPVSAVCASDGSMYDVFDGQFRFELVMANIMKLYEDNISSEYAKVVSRMEKHTSKYTNK